jgi:hypothetical protein
MLRRLPAGGGPATTVEKEKTPCMSVKEEENSSRLARQRDAVWKGHQDVEQKGE